MREWFRNDWKIRIISDNNFIKFPFLSCSSYVIFLRRLFPIFQSLLIFGTFCWFYFLLSSYFCLTWFNSLLVRLNNFSQLHLNIILFSPFLRSCLIISWMCVCLHAYMFLYVLHECKGCWYYLKMFQSFPWSVRLYAYVRVVIEVIIIYRT